MDERKAAVEESHDSEESEYGDFATPQQQQDNGSQDLEWDGHEENPSFQFEEAASFLGDDQGDGDGRCSEVVFPPSPALCSVVFPRPH